jgi:hypothetical protein
MKERAFLDMRNRFKSSPLLKTRVVAVKIPCLIDHWSSIQGRVVFGWVNGLGMRDMIGRDEAGLCG